MKSLSERKFSDNDPTISFDGVHREDYLLKFDDVRKAVQRLKESFRKTKVYEYRQIWKRIEAIFGGELSE